jgi:hypothetical protein
MSIKSKFPSIKPSLLLDFANVKQLDPRVTFVRTTTATYYDGKTTAKAEENLFLYSQELESAYWIKSGVTVTTNADTAPDGTSTAEKIVETATTSAHVLQRPILVNGTTYTASCFLKAAERSFAFLSIGAANNAISIDLTLGTATNAAGTTNNITCTSAGNGWYRVSFSVTAGVSPEVNVYVSEDGVWANRSYAGNASNGILCWGLQLEQRSAVTAYTPTTTQPITNYVPALQTAASGVARFDHKPTTFESLGLLVEEQRTNLLTYSEQFDNAAWTKTNSSTTSNTIVAPDGTLTGDKLVEDTATNVHLARQSPTGTVTAVHTFSCYAKAAERSVIALQLVDNASTGNGIASYFNLLTGATSNISNFGNGSGAVATMTAVGNGWYRCTLSGITNTSGTTFRAIVFVVQTAGSTSYTGDGYSGLYIWGAQLEAGAFPTSYIPTVAATVTRNADAASMTGTNFSSWYRADEGTVYGDALFGDLTAGRLIAGISGASAVDRITIGLGTNYDVAVVANNVVQANFALGTKVPNSKIAFAYKTDDFAGSANGSAVGTDTSGILPVVDRFFIGTRVGLPAASIINGHIRKLSFYPSRLSDAQLQALTTV